MVAQMIDAGSGESVTTQTAFGATRPWDSRVAGLPPRA